MSVDQQAGQNPEAVARLLRQRVQREPVWVPVEGTSMGRAILAGSRVLLTAARAPRLGEVWAFYNDHGVLVVHRYMGRRRGAARFQGDAQNEDPPVSFEALVGRAVLARHDGRQRRFGELERLSRGIPLLLLSRARGLARRVRRRIGRTGAP